TLLVVLLFSATAMAQEKTLTGEFSKTGGYWGPAVKVSSIDGNTVFHIGGAGGAVFDKKYFVGGGFFAMVSKTDIYGLNYGGLIVDYITNSDNLTHVSFGTLVGFGEIEYKRQSTGSIKVFVLEPDVKFMVNVNKDLRIGLGVGYRFITGSKHSDDFRGPSATLTFKFGSFSQ
ncbi:hypothetical protein ACFL5P_02410, partial [candidate division KSB1 bacterium]